MAIHWLHYFIIGTKRKRGNIVCTGKASFSIYNSVKSPIFINKWEWRRDRQRYFIVKFLTLSIACNFMVANQSFLFFVFLLKEIFFYHCYLHHCNIAPFQSEWSTLKRQALSWFNLIICLVIYEIACQRPFYIKEYILCWTLVLISILQGIDQLFSKNRDL